jgi:hypothetical protein
MHLPLEPPGIIPEHRPPKSWPQEGRIDLQDLKVNNGELLFHIISLKFPEKWA